MLKIQDKAPDFSLMDGEHHIHTLSKHKGQYVIVYFYPKDDTPGCTKEACAFRDKQETLLKNQAVVYGISRDSTQSHAKFSQKYDLNFTLLSDPELQAHKAYDVLEEKKIRRSTFLIDQKGYILKIWPNVRVEGHVDEILNTLKALHTS